MQSTIYARELICSKVNHQLFLKAIRLLLTFRLAQGSLKTILHKKSLIVETTICARASIASFPLAVWLVT